MSELVGSTPSLTRRGRSSASFSRSSSSLVICVAPCFNNARASSGCMINHRIAHRARALLVFVQQLAHLLDCERRILPVKRFLTFTLIKEGPVLRVRTAGDLFVRLRGLAGPARRPSWIRRVADRLLCRNSRCGTSAVEGLRIELLRRKVASTGKTLGIGLFLDIKCANGCLFIYGGGMV